MDSPVLRTHLRKHMRQQRNALSATSRHRANRHLCQKLCASPVFQRAQRIALYLANDNEIDPAAIAQVAWQRNKQVFLPILHPHRAHPMQFARYRPGGTLVNNRYGIAEPANERPIPHWTLDLVLMPLVAFDSHGNRLGMGGGYYDKTFADLAKRPSRPQLVGLAYDFQQVQELPFEPWDVPLHQVMTGKTSTE